MNPIQRKILNVYTILRCILGLIILLGFNHISCNNVVIFKLNIMWILTMSYIFTRFNMDFFETILAYSYWFMIEIIMLYYLQDCAYNIWYVYPIIDLSLFGCIMLIYISLHIYQKNKNKIHNPELSVPIIQTSSITQMNMYEEL